MIRDDDGDDGRRRGILTRTVNFRTSISNVVLFQ